MSIRETAYAKINLALHVRRRRADGYHELETLFAFVDAGDTLEFMPGGETDRVDVAGEFAATLSDPAGNIVMKALDLLPRGARWTVQLEKRLPVAAGLGGGSADAGAIFRLVERNRGLPQDWQDRAATLGADVPACVRSHAARGRGTGTELEEVANDLTGTPVLLVNPRVALPTGPVFRAWDGIDRGPMPDGDMRAIAMNGRNDLEPGAIGLVPQIRDVLEALAASGAWLARMSGSGATCFALYDKAGQRDAAARGLTLDHPDWWQLAGALR